jgi:hypothetical protein
LRLSLLKVALVAFPNQPVVEVRRDDATFGYGQPEVPRFGPVAVGSDEYEPGYVRVYVAAAQDSRR